MMKKEGGLRVKAKFFRGLADPTRLAILEYLRAGERTAGEIVRETGESQSNVSNHLRCLLDCGLLQNRREGKTVRYRLRNARVKGLLGEADAVLSEVYGDILACLHYKK